MHRLHFVRVTAACTPTRVGNPRANGEAIERALESLADADIVVLGELALSGYTCGELFLQSTLLEGCIEALRRLSHHVGRQLVVVGLPLEVGGKLFNCAAVMCNGSVLGIVPKTHLPSYGEFYESRWFHSGAEADCHDVSIDGLGDIPFGTDLLFTCGDAVVGIEICEDLWVPIPPSSQQAIAGANILLNLSASNETIGKANYRQQLVAMQSGRCLAAYAYASAGPSESTTDLVFGGHCLIGENGSILAQSRRIGTGLLLQMAGGPDGVTSHAAADIDLGRLMRDRRAMATMHQTSGPEKPRAFRRIPFELPIADGPLKRSIDPHPFVPASTSELHVRCAEVFEIQCAGLLKRVQQLPESSPLVIGVSGGLDSTLTLLVAAKLCERIGWGTQRILGITMPGFGTTGRTKSNALALMQALGIRSETIDIRESCLRVFQTMQHRPFGIDPQGLDADRLQAQLEQLPDEHRADLVFENVQARMRTLLLMSRGFVLGTGDMSELALGWCTYNADHMSMYNVNTSVPKTLVKFLVRYVAEHLVSPEIREILLDIANTPISPELLPLARDRSMHQRTEATIGPYELHDFYLYHWVRGGAGPEKLLLLAQHAAFDRPYSRDELHESLKIFFRRFFASQFKRSCVPDGPKVGSVSLSPRGDWRMPSDADAEAWLRALDELQ